MAAQAPEASPPPTTPMDPISAIQVQLQSMVKAAGDCLEASTQHNAAASDVIDMKVEALADSLVGMHQHIDRLADLLPDGNIPLQDRFDTLRQLDDENTKAVEELRAARADAGLARTALAHVTNALASGVLPSDVPKE